MPDKASRTSSVTPASEASKKEDDVESVELVDEPDDESYDEESCEEERKMRVRFKVRGLLRVNKWIFFLTDWILRGVDKLRR